ncbi:hypothetical protein DFH11DRAFT_1570630 [Phellopilus nigrolimitatus]|nr:hypothetical protein DFH11DRAFT_1570630 [Phellopilus nigrolimitatus]
MIYSQQRRTTPFSRWKTNLLYLLLAVHSGMGAFTSEPRWGQATAMINELLFVHGGKTDEFNAYSYTSAPTTNDLLLLDLSQGFDPSSPPWQYISGSANSSTTQGQELAWHTLSAYNITQLLLFGGDGGPNSPIVLPSQSNSAQLLDVSTVDSPAWITETEGWANEPSRRIHHSTASSGGRIYLIGGEKDDGSSLGYSDHYAFDPNQPSFTQLPTSNGPPDIYGHASVILSDGRLLVFGGYSQSESQLIPFTTIWSMDTTQSTLTWTSASVSSSAVPPARRAFASVWLEGDQVLIHGGSDADFQTSYSDGWILDTTVSPMTWSNVSALAELGPRRDHFAVQVDSEVLFGFGYEINAGASVAISIFDISKNTFTTSFTPQSTSAPSHTTLPMPSGTGVSSAGGSHGSGPGGTAGSRPTGSGNSQPSDGGDPGSPSGNGGNGPNKNSTAKIAIASVFGVLALVAAAAIVVIVIIRRRHSQERFHLLGNDDPESPSSFPPRNGKAIAFLPWIGARHGPNRGEKARMANQADGRTFLGIGRPKTNAESPMKRIDMLANEDSSQYADGGILRRLGSGSSKSWYSINAPSNHERYASGGSRRPSLGRILSGSLSSVKSMGAMLGSGIRRVTSEGSASRHTRVRTDASLPLDPFDDNEDSEELLLQDEGNRYTFDAFRDDELGAAVQSANDNVAARPRGGRLQGSEFSKYSDPFQDQEESHVLFDASASVISENCLGNENQSLGVAEKGLTDNDARSTRSTLSHSPKPPQLTSLITAASKTSSDNPSSSSLFSSSNGEHLSSISSQQAVTALSVSSSARPRASSLVGSLSSPIHAVKRSDSWWTRFKRSSARDSMHDQAKSPTANLDLDFRDPNPPPGRLGAIKEASGGSGGSTEPLDSMQSGRARQGGRDANHSHIYSTSGHERSTTSFKTSQTADSAALERMAGRVDVVQREATGTSIDYNSSISSSMERSHERSGTLSSIGERRTSGDRPSPPGTADRSQDIVDSAGFIDLDGPREIVQSPTEAAFSFPPLPKTTLDTSGNSIPGTPNPLSARAKGKRPESNGAVAARIAEYERRTELSSPTSPSSPRKLAARRNTIENSAVGEQKICATQKPARVKYGLVKRPELFVANPDHRHSRASFES